jgi:hypothetical protein
MPWPLTDAMRAPVVEARVRAPAAAIASGCAWNGLRLRRCRGLLVALCWEAGLWGRAPIPPFRDGAGVVNTLPVWSEEVPPCLIAEPRSNAITAVAG